MPLPPFTSDDKEPEDLKDQEDDGKDEDPKADVGVNPQKLIDEIMHRGEQILKYPPRIDAFLNAVNTQKNRFPNVLLYDKSRVKIVDKLGSDYYHASYVDSYDKADAFILAQAPFDSATETDFWRMCYQQKPTLIVILIALVSGEGKRLAKSFWPETKDDRAFADGALKVRCLNSSQERDFDNYNLVITSSNRSKVRTQLVHFRKWIEDRQIPDNLLEFRAMLKIAAARAEKEGRGEGPIMFVCPSGVNRCGTMVALDVVIDRMTYERKVGLLETIAVVRRQRYGCFAHFEHYSHVADLVVKHAVASGIADAAAIGVRRKN